VSSSEVSLRPDAFDYDSATWAIVLAEQYRFRGDRRRMLAYADTSVTIAGRKTASHALGTEQTRMFMALGLAYQGRGEAGIREAEDVMRLPRRQDARDNPYLELLMARIYLAAGQRDRALDALEHIMGEPYYITPAWLRIDPNFLDLHGNPRFERLAAGTPPPVA
jgi:predicted Zn-dependent protease